MKATINTIELKEAFTQCKKGLKRNVSIIDLEYYHIKTNGMFLTVTTSDLNTQISFNIRSIGNIECLLPELGKILPKLEGNETTIEIVNDKIIVTSGEDVLTFDNRPSEDYPLIKDETQILLSEITDLDLITELKLQDKFRGNDDLRPNLNGTYFEISEGLRLTSTNANYLKTNNLESNNKGADNFIINSAACKLIQSIKPTKEDFNKCQIFTINNEAGKYIKFRFLNIEITTFAVNENYPNYRQVIPEDNPIKINFESKPFIKAIDKAKVFNDVIIELSFNGVCSVYACDYDLIQEYKTNVAAEKTGEDIRIGFNPSYLTDCLLSENITMELSTPKRAAIINKTDKGLVLLMPTMITN